MTAAPAPLDGVTLAAVEGGGVRATYPPGVAAAAAAAFDACAAAGLPIALQERDGEALRGPGPLPTLLALGAVVRNRAAGPFAARYGLPVGTDLDPRVVEWRLEDDALGRPLLNDATAVAIHAVHEHDLEGLWELTVGANEALGPWFEARDLDLIEVALRFGRREDGTVALLGPFTPATFTVWDLAADDDATPVPDDRLLARLAEGPA